MLESQRLDFTLSAYTIHRSVKLLAFHTHTHSLLRPAQLLLALYKHRWAQEAPRNGPSFSRSANDTSYTSIAEIESEFVSRCGAEYPRPPSLCKEALQE